MKNVIYFLISFFWLLYSCDVKISHREIKKNQNVGLSAHMDTLVLGLDNFITLERIFMMSSKQVMDTTFNTPLIYLGKKNDSVFVAFINNLEFLCYPTEKLGCVYANEFDNFINQYKKMGYEMVYDSDFPPYLCLYTTKDSLCFSGKKESGFSVYFHLTDTLISFKPYFKIGDPYNYISNRFGLQTYLGEVPQNFTLIFEHYSIIQKISGLSDDDFLSLKYLISVYKDKPHQQKCKYISNCGNYKLVYKKGKLKEVQYNFDITEENLIHNISNCTCPKYN